MCSYSSNVFYHAKVKGNWWFLVFFGFCFCFFFAVGGGWGEAGEVGFSV